MTVSLPLPPLAVVERAGTHPLDSRRHVRSSRLVRSPHAQPISSDTRSCSYRSASSPRSDDATHHGSARGGGGDGYHRVGDRTGRRGLVRARVSPSACVPSRVMEEEKRATEKDCK